MLDLIIRLIQIVIFIATPSRSLQGRGSNTEAQHEADKGYSCENTKCQNFSLWPPDRKGPTARPAAERVCARPLRAPRTEWLGADKSALVNPPTAAAVLMSNTKQSSIANNADFLDRRPFSSTPLYPIKGMSKNEMTKPSRPARYDHLFPILSRNFPKTQIWKTIVTIPENPSERPIS
ncbi:hypothetical protein TMatcc_004853 [Talaromyces marneffei ATCC 18224]